MHLSYVMININRTYRVGIVKMQKQRSIVDFLPGQKPDDHFLYVDSENPTGHHWVTSPHVSETLINNSFLLPKRQCYQLLTPRNCRMFIEMAPPQSLSASHFQEEPTENLVSMVPFLKSQIQKAVRRNLVREGVQAAWILMKQDAMEFFRRLPIIMIEDKKIHQDFPLVIWMMLTYDGKTPIPFNLAERLIWIVYDLCSEPKMADFKRSLDRNLPEDFKKGTIAKFKNLSSRDKCLVASCIIRADYGGTTNDVDMMNRYALWQLNDPIEPIAASWKSGILGTLDIQDVMTPDAWIIQAFDFHVTKMIPYILKNTKSALVEQQLKGAGFTHTDITTHHDRVQRTIWMYWSSVRYCPDCNTTDASCPHQFFTESERKLVGLWDLISQKVQQYATSWLQKIISLRKRKNREREYPGIEKVLTACNLQDEVV